MKLIVLYGETSSGKTTSLKVVYGVLKRLNIDELHAFEYLDIDTYRDFLDVLSLNPQTINDRVDMCVNDTKGYCMPKSFVGSNINDIDTTDLKNDMYNARKELDEWENTPSKTIFSLRDDYINVLQDVVLSESFTDKIKIGLNLEGDFGCNNEKNRPSLFERLDMLKSTHCEIVITACRITRDPFKCLQKFIKDNNVTACFIPVLKKRALLNAARVLWVLKNII